MDGPRRTGTPLGRATRSAAQLIREIRRSIPAMSEARLCIASHASDSDYAPSSRVLLWKLGYALVPAEEATEPALRVVRDDRLAEVAASPSVPIILLTRERSARAHDPRVAGTLRRPARLHELYRLIQASLEEHPRSVPRVPTSLCGKGSAEDQHWDFDVRSLSENGCLVTGSKLPRQGQSFELDIELPWGQRLATPAVAGYEQRECLGLVFHGITLSARKKIAKAVLELLSRA
jgi:hypothetical protein